MLPGPGSQPVSPNAAAENPIAIVAAAIPFKREAMFAVRLRKNGGIERATTRLLLRTGGGLDRAIVGPQGKRVKHTAPAARPVQAAAAAAILVGGRGVG